MITIKEVAEYAKVSQSTVSRALNGHSSVKESNRKKVFDAIEALGYKPNAFAQALASNRSFSIGMLVGTLDGPFYGPLMHTVEGIVRKENYHLILTSGQEMYEEEQESIHFLEAKKVDGLVLTSDRLTDSDILQIVKNTPATILMNRYIPEMADRCICMDNEQGGFIAVEHLIEMGHKRIACVTGQLSKNDSRDRLQGYRSALTKFDLDYDPNLVIEGRFDHGKNHEAIGRLLDRAPDITAIFCMNDNIALAAYGVCNERGLKIGEDISIVGFDNDTHSAYVSPPLTTVNFPKSEMAEQAANGVLNIIKGKGTEGLTNRLSPSLVLRNSVKQF
ncbi:LacI family DNA-binding transcriptional regulator [Vibrio sp. SCSIO 43136]|uniref:LacI family DNA-binding transcriptional regulator n=1 Tax=Vibrio sp. SCSIO 43136 TaxID=2819101 RepID=UPI0020751EFD|nr:LacI family DNA-binding transcriptional regulator [Vibrio sp. SCSIO 43136]USD67825.1 LacI family DNA-binding transcriptional regulator [Vibrio sp. SCSIO 43136]